MPREPEFQFQPALWTQDTRVLSLAAKGAWIDLLCAMWNSPNRGVLYLTRFEYARLLSTTEDEAERVLIELVDKSVCDHVTLLKRECNAPLFANCNSLVTLTCRRMERQENVRKSVRLRVTKLRSRECNAVSNANVTNGSSIYSLINKEKREGRIAKEGKRPFPQDFTVTDEIRAWAAENDLPDADYEFDSFRDYHVSKGTRFSDWVAAFRNWIRKAQEYDPKAPRAKRTEEKKVRGKRFKFVVPPEPEPSKEEVEEAKTLIHNLAKGLTEKMGIK